MRKRLAVLLLAGSLALAAIDAAVASVSPAQLAQQAAKTDIERGKGAVRRAGIRKVTVASPTTQRLALSVYGQMRADGNAAHIRPERSGEGFVVHVRLASLPTKADAEALAARLCTKYGLAVPAASRSGCTARAKSLAIGLRVAADRAAKRCTWNRTTPAAPHAQLNDLRGGL